jgi:mRNA interferase RelE/StbE
MAYKIVLVKSAVKELEKLSAKIHDKIVEHLRQIEANPRMFGAEKLTARQEYKLRVGNHRIIYSIDDVLQEVKILMIEDRKQVYKRIKRSKP